MAFSFELDNLWRGFYVSSPSLKANQIKKDPLGPFLFGAVTANVDELVALVSDPHDTIKFSQNPATSSLAEFRRLYLKGLSLNEVSDITGFAVSTIRDLLVRNNVALRAATKATASDPKEIKVVRKIRELHRKGLKFNAIKRWLNDQKIPSKLSSKWNDKTVASIIRSQRSASKNHQRHSRSTNPTHPGFESFEAAKGKVVADKILQKVMALSSGNFEILRFAVISYCCGGFGPRNASLLCDCNSLGTKDVSCLPGPK